MEHIRNFCIISHIDHGKSTLADRFLELTGTVPNGKMRPQYLDTMDLEREKGITIKMQPVRMLWHPYRETTQDNTQNNAGPFGVVSRGVSRSSAVDSEYILNLIDTPGHVDFGYEVSRALACVEGAILLVDATQGIQAQTLANLDLAKKQNLTIIPAINKIDSPQARTQEAKEELANLLNIPKEEIFEISAKAGTNVEELLRAVIEKVPPPKYQISDTKYQISTLRALIFDSRYDSYKGIIAFVRVVDGQIRPGEKIFLLQAKAEGEAKEVGYFKPELESSQELIAGEIGYIATGIKEPDKVRVGDTIINLKFKNQNEKLPEALPGYEMAKPMVFASIYPEDPDEFDNLKVALAKLKLNDAALSFEPESKEALGRGFRCGFLGTLHAEIISERLLREFGLNLVISTPQVFYKIITQQGKELSVYSPGDWPDQTQIKEMQEPWAELEIITPLNYLGQISELLKASEGLYIKTDYLGKERVILFYEVPLRKIITGFYDNLKGVSQGFSSMNYKMLGWRPADLVKIDILIAGKKEDVLSRIVSNREAFSEGKKMVSKLKEIMPSQLFSVPLQAAISGKIIARETISAKRKDVTGYLYGGDYTRKRKLLEKQKKGKQELKKKGQLHVPPKVFLEMFKI